MFRNEKGTKVIRVGKELVEVTDEVYKAYYKAENHEDYMKRLDVKNKLVYIGGSEIFSNIQDPEPLTLDKLIAEETSKELAKCLSALSDYDRNLIHAIYYEKKSIRQIAKEQNVDEKTVRNRRDGILKNLKSSLKESA